MLNCSEFFATIGLLSICGRTSVRRLHCHHAARTAITKRAYCDNARPVQNQNQDDNFQRYRIRTIWSLVAESCSSVRLGQQRKWTYSISLQQLGMGRSHSCSSCTVWDVDMWSRVPAEIMHVVFYLPFTWGDWKCNICQMQYHEIDGPNRTKSYVSCLWKLSSCFWFWTGSLSKFLWWSVALIFTFY